MAETVVLKPAAAKKLIFDALTGSGTALDNARYFTDAILDTELAGLDGHGFFWLQFYCEHARSGKVNGKVKPAVKKLSLSLITSVTNRTAPPCRSVANNPFSVRGFQRRCSA